MLSTTQSMLFGETVKIKSLLTKRVIANTHHPGLHQIFEQILSDNIQLADRVALTESNGKCITFGQLNHHANQLAASINRAISILKNGWNGHQDSRIVAVCIPPSIDLIISLLAIFKIGSAYVPIEYGSASSNDRLIHILRDSKAICLLTHDNGLLLAAQEASVPLFDLDELKNYVADDEENFTENHHDRNELAVVLYTSGSSKTSRGIRLDHRKILRRLEWEWTRFPYESDEVGCLKTDPTSVESILEIWGPILRRKPLFIAPKLVLQDTERFIELLEDARITRIALDSSLFKTILTTLTGRKDRNICRPLNRLKTWICSGEVLPAQLLLKFYTLFPEGTKICNFHSDMTENLSDVNFSAFESRSEVMDCLLEKKAPIGVPMFDCATSLLDSYRNLLEKKLVKELFLVGIHLCRENNFYNNQDEVDTQFYYEGRVRNQVKAGGNNKIGLNETSSVVNKLEKVSLTDIISYKVGETKQEVMIFVVPKSTGTKEVIEKELENKLSFYIKPKVVEVDHIPLLHYGKVNRRKLIKIYQNQKEQNRLATPIGSFGFTSENFTFIDSHSLNVYSLLNKLREQGFQLEKPDFFTASEKLKDLAVVLFNKYTENGGTHPFSCLIIEPFSSSFKEEIIKIIGSAFSTQDIFVALTKHMSKKDLSETLWNDILKQNLSFVIKDIADGRILAISINFDASVKLKEFDASVFKSSYFLEFLDRVQTPIIEKNLTTKANYGYLMHCMLSGTVDDVSLVHRVILIRLIETEKIRLARRRGFSKLITTNTTPLARDVCVVLHGHQIVLEYSINQFVASDGTKPYSLAPESTMAIITIKCIEEE